MEKINNYSFIFVLIVLLLAPSIFTEFQTYLLTYGLVMAIASIALNLLLGYTGLMSFGHGMFIGTGAYTVALMAKYAGINTLELMIPLGIVFSAALAAFVGLFCTRQIEIYFSMLTLAFGELLFVICSKFYETTGGTDGIHIENAPLFGHVFKESAETYYLVLTFTILSIFVMRLITKSPFGMAIQATRDNEVRMGYLGLMVMKFRLIAFIISGAFTGLAGVLLVTLTGHAVPELFQVGASITLVLMVILGGHTTFYGPAVGAMVFVFLQSWLQPLFFWQFFLGAAIVILVIFLPGGVLGGIKLWTAKLMIRKSS